MGSSANFKEAADLLDANNLNDMMEEIGCETYVGQAEFRKLVYMWTLSTYPQYKDSKALDTLSERLFLLLDVSGSYTLNLNLLQETLSEVLAKNEHLPLFAGMHQSESRMPILPSKRMSGERIGQKRVSERVSSGRLDDRSELAQNLELSKSIKSNSELINVSLLSNPTNSNYIVKTEQVLIDKALPLDAYTSVLRSTFLAGDVADSKSGFSFLFYNKDQFLFNGNYSLNSYDFDGDQLNIFPLLGYKKFIATSHIDPRTLLSTNSVSENVTYKLSKAGKGIKGYVIITEVLLHLFHLVGKDKFEIQKVFLLNACSFSLEDDYIRLHERKEKERELMICYSTAVTRTGRFVQALRMNCKNTRARAVMGAPLSLVMRRRKDLSAEGVPGFLQAMVDYLNTPANLSEEGLFRKSGESDVMDNIIQRIDGGDAEFTNVAELHSVTSVMKRWLGQLPVPLLHPYTKLVTMEVEQSDGTLLATLLEYIKTETESDAVIVLHFLCRFLHAVSQYQEKNLMTIDNLALVFGPNLIRPTKKCDVDVITQQTNAFKVARVIATLITHHDALAPLAEASRQRLLEKINAFPDCTQDTDEERDERFKAAQEFARAKRQEHRRTEENPETTITQNLIKRASSQRFTKVLKKRAPQGETQDKEKEKDKEKSGKSAGSDKLAALPSNPSLSSSQSATGSNQSLLSVSSKEKDSMRKASSSSDLLAQSSSKAKLLLEKQNNEIAYLENELTNLKSFLVSFGSIQQQQIDLLKQQLRQQEEYIKSQKQKRKSSKAKSTGSGFKKELEITQQVTTLLDNFLQIQTLQLEQIKAKKFHAYEPLEDDECDLEETTNNINNEPWDTETADDAESNANSATAAGVASAAEVERQELAVRKSSSSQFSSDRLEDQRERGGAQAGKPLTHSSSSPSISASAKSLGDSKSGSGFTRRFTVTNEEERESETPGETKRLLPLQRRLTVNPEELAQAAPRVILSTTNATTPSPPTTTTSTDSTGATDQQQHSPTPPQSSTGTPQSGSAQPVLERKSLTRRFHTVSVDPSKREEQQRIGSSGRPLSGKERPISLGSVQNEIDKKENSESSEFHQRIAAHHQQQREREQREQEGNVSPRGQSHAMPIPLPVNPQVASECANANASNSPVSPRGEVRMGRRPLSNSSGTRQKVDAEKK